MDHVVYLDKKANELEKLKSGEKTMLIRGAAGRKMPYGRVNTGDTLYLLENDSSGLIRAKADVKTVINSEKMDKDQSVALVEKYLNYLQLTDSQIKRWAGKRYLVLIELTKLELLEPFAIDKSDYDNMDDWLPVNDIQVVKLN
jgi:hypothetical protein